MNTQEQDKHIRDFLDQVPDNYNFNQDEITYLKQYSGCQLPIPDSVIAKLREMVMQKIPSIFDETTVNFPSLKPKHLLTVGFMADRVLEGNYATVTAFQSDYYCYLASKGMQQERITNGSYRLKFRNLSDYFTNYKGNNTRYSAAVVVPVATGYHRMDTDSNYAFIDSYSYYILRAYQFVRAGGSVFAAIPKDGHKFSEASKLLPGVEVTVNMLDNYYLIQIDKPTE